jgi:ATPase subunit of ABC transporter with duplicated ATPase domains
MCTTLARRPHYLLLDEPENHLDIFARQILISMIREYRGCVVFVSHDQEFINAVTNRIVEVVDGTLQSYTGTYEFYLEHKARLEAGAQRTWNAHEKKVEQLDRLIKRMREWVKKNPDLGAQLRARKTQLRHLQEKAPNRPKTHSKMKLGIGEVEQKNTKRMLMSNGLTLKRGDSTILWNTDVYLSFGEKVAIVGRNGSGKTSFLKAVMGEIPITAGELKVGVGADIGYFSQESLAVLDPNKTPLDVISTVMRAPDHQQRALLARYLIGADACTRKISTLSGGQKTRLRFCLLFAAGHDFLLLDEPTNHLDPVSWEILTESLKEFGGTVLLVSHDRMFIDQVAKKLWIVEDTSISEFAGTLSEYLLEG